MTEFVTIGTTDELKPGAEPIILEVGRRWVAVYNINGEYHAIEDVCPHDGGPLAEGDVEGDVVACPRHGARFKVTTGELLSGPAGTTDVPTYEVRVEGDEIQLGVTRHK
jgi:nitrite reductase/ring-hydroxylating ferredoxin subunit